MNGLRRIFKNGQGELRFGWRMAIGIAAGAGTLFGVRLLLGYAFGVLFKVWGLTADNLIYAPYFARQITVWHADFTYIAAYTSSILIGVWLAKRWTQPAPNDSRMIVFAAIAGAACGGALTFIALVFDSMRLEWPLGEPSFSPKLISGIVVLILGCLCNEVLGKRLVFDPLRERFGRLAAYLAAVACSVFADPTLQEMPNSILLGLIGCLVYERGGLLASAALQAGWMIWTNLVFAWPDAGSACIYRMYEVSESWLTGGNAGAEAGIGCTVFWIIIAAILLRKELRGMMERMNRRRDTHGKDSHCNRRSGFPR